MVSFMFGKDLVTKGARALAGTICCWPRSIDRFKCFRLLPQDSKGYLIKLRMMSFCRMLYDVTFLPRYKVSHNSHYNHSPVKHDITYKQWQRWNLCRPNIGLTTHILYWNDPNVWSRLQGNELMVNRYHYITYLTHCGLVTPHGNIDMD